MHGRRLALVLGVDPHAPRDVDLAEAAVRQQHARRLVVVREAEARQARQPSQRGVAAAIGCSGGVEAREARATQHDACGALEPPCARRDGRGRAVALGPADAVHAHNQVDDALADRRGRRLTIEDEARVDARSPHRARRRRAAAACRPGAARERLVAREGLGGARQRRDELHVVNHAAHVAIVARDEDDCRAERAVLHIVVVRGEPVHRRRAPRKRAVDDGGRRLGRGDCAVVARARDVGQQAELRQVRDGRAVQQ